MAMTSRDGVQMDIPAVKKVADTFGDISETLTKVSNALKGFITLLNTTAFIGLVGGWALKSYLERLQPQIKNMADECKKVNEDLKVSIDAYERGDQAGATRFF